MTQNLATSRPRVAFGATLIAAVVALAWSTSFSAPFHFDDHASILDNASIRRLVVTQAEFARREGVRYPSFASWVQQQRAAKGTPPAAVPKVRFAEVQLPAAVGTPTVEVRLTDGTLVRGASAREVAAVARALRS